MARLYSHAWCSLPWATTIHSEVRASCSTCRRCAAFKLFVTQPTFLSCSYGDIHSWHVLLQVPAVSKSYAQPASAYTAADAGNLKDLTLYSADHPARVLNKGLSYYRMLFNREPIIKGDMLATLVALRCDWHVFLCCSSLSAGCPADRCCRTLSVCLCGGLDMCQGLSAEHQSTHHGCCQCCTTTGMHKTLRCS